MFLKDLATKRNLGRIDFVVLNSNLPAIQFYQSFDDIKEVDFIKYMRIDLEG